MHRRTRVVIAAATIAGTAIAGGSIALAAGDDTEVPITQPALARASAAALEHTGGGRVTETEIGDEESYYEVEVTLDDGSQIEVQLDKSFTVVGSEADDDTAEDEGEHED